jgi:hypothetical protein
MDHQARRDRALLRELAERHNPGIAAAHGSRGPMPVRNLPNTAKVREAGQGDVRHGAWASVKSRKTGFWKISGDDDPLCVE